MYIGRVIAKQRLGKLSKSASHYPQIWHVNLETLSIYRCLSLWKLRQNKRKILQFDEKCFLFTNFWITSENNFQKSFKLRLVSTFAEKIVKKKSNTTCDLTRKIWVEPISIWQKNSACIFLKMELHDFFSSNPSNNQG